MGGSRDKLLIRKLYAHDDDHYFEEIRTHNLNSLDEWKIIYPGHDYWVNEVINELKNDTNNRVAFGGFFFDMTKHKYVLCCSVLVKKNPFSPYLEIKNLIVLKCKQPEYKDELYKDYQEQLIQYIRNFAQQRGYPKLVTELLNRNKKDKDLIKLFIENDFIIAGSHSDKYIDSDEILFLTTEINQIYGFDPYDDINATFWVLKKYLGSSKPKRSGSQVELVDEDDVAHTLKCYSFFSGTKYLDDVESKFNTQHYVVIIGDHFLTIRRIKKIKHLNLPPSGNFKFFVFDFSFQSLLLQIQNKSRFTLFSRTDINSLLGYKSNPERLRRCEYHDMGGLLIISNPTRFDFSSAKMRLESREQFIYIKLGRYGRYLREDTPLVFAYFHKNSNRTKISIWGVASLANPAQLVDIEQLRTAIMSSDDLDKSQSDGQILYAHLNSDEASEAIAPATPLWTVDEFLKHNKYNATNSVIGFTINGFWDLYKSNDEIDINDILDNQNQVTNLEDIFDFYLSKQEVDNLNSRLNDITQTNPSEATQPSYVYNNADIKEPYNFLFIGASPNDLNRLDNEQEYQILGNIDKASKVLRQLPPSLATDYKKLREEIIYKKPNIIYFTGHGEQSGIYLRNPNDGKKALLLNEELDEIFKNRTFIHLVFLNSCWSESQAEIISANGMYVVGMKGEATLANAAKFAQHFFENFVLEDKSTISDRINNGWRGCEVNLRRKLEISVWKDGKKLSRNIQRGSAKK